MHLILTIPGNVYVQEDPKIDLQKFILLIVLKKIGSTTVPCGMLRNLIFLTCQKVDIFLTPCASPFRNCHYYLSHTNLDRARACAINPLAYDGFKKNHHHSPCVGRQSWPALINMLVCSFSD